MKEADPNCVQCGGRGWVFLGRDPITETCPCVELIHPEYDLGPGAVNYHVGTWKEPIKPKRKRHLLKRKKRTILYTARDRALERILRHFCI